MLAHHRKKRVPLPWPIVFHHSFYAKCCLIFYSVFPSKWLFICIRVLDLDLFFYKVLACIVYLGTCRCFTSLLCNSQLLLSGMHVIFVSIFPDCLKKFELCLWCSIDFQKLTEIPRFPRVTKLYGREMPNKSWCDLAWDHPYLGKITMERYCDIVLRSPLYLRSCLTYLFVFFWNKILIVRYSCEIVLCACDQSFWSLGVWHTHNRCKLAGMYVTQKVILPWISLDTLVFLI